MTLLSGSIFLFSAAKVISMWDGRYGKENFVAGAEALGYGMMERGAEVSSVTLRI
jgi:hypothetical protein